MANTSAIWQQAVHTTYKLSSPSPSCWTRAKPQQETSGEWTIHYTALAEKWHGRKSMMIRLKNKQTKNKNGDGNGDSNIRPEISDTNHRGETSDISGLHSAVRLEAMRTKEWNAFGRNTAEMNSEDEGLCSTKTLC